MGVCIPGWKRTQNRIPKMIPEFLNLAWLAKTEVKNLLHGILDSGCGTSSTGPTDRDPAVYLLHGCWTVTLPGIYCMDAGIYCMWNLLQGQDSRVEWCWSRK